MNILVICGSGIGGTEKAAFLFAGELLRRGHAISILSDPDQPRMIAFKAAGGRVIEDDYRKENLIRRIQEFEIDVIHQHVSGYGDHRELYAALDELGEARPKLIETNVFGQLLDYHDQGHVDYRLFITFTSGMQAFMRTRIRNADLDHQLHNVLFYPMPRLEIPVDWATLRRHFRRSLNILENEFLVIRVGRPSHKWTDWECKAFAKARKQNPLLKLYLIEPNQKITRDIQNGRYGEGIIIGKATSDAEFLTIMYLAADLLLHASNFGESFGYTIAEAMQASLPIITLATSWGDNAQTELVSHGETGYVCGSIRGMANALVALSLDPETCSEMGKAAAMRISQISSIDTETDILEGIILSLTGKSPSNIVKKRFMKWIKFIEERKITKPHYYEVDTGDNLGQLETLLYRKFRETKTLKKYIRLKYLNLDVVHPRKLASLPIPWVQD